MTTYIKFNACNPPEIRYWIEQHPDDLSQKTTITYIDREQYCKMWEEGTIINVASLECPVEICRPIKEVRKEQMQKEKLKDDPLEQVEVKITQLSNHDYVAWVDGLSYPVIHPSVIRLPAYVFLRQEEDGGEIVRYYKTQYQWVWALYDEEWYAVWKQEQTRWAVQKEQEDDPLEQVQVEILEDSGTKRGYYLYSIVGEGEWHHIINEDVICLPAYALEKQEHPLDRVHRVYKTQRRWVWALYDEDWYKIWKREQTKHEARIQAHDKRFTRPRRGNVS